MVFYLETALENINKSCIDELVITDTINNQSKLKKKRIRVLTVSNLIAKAIKRIIDKKSISDLFL